MKTAVAQILDAHPRQVSSIDSRVLAECIEACGACAQACTACADACLSEPSTADVIANVRSSLDCADICAATSRVLTRADDSRIAVAAAMLQACVAACSSCQSACGSTATESSAPYEHAAACRLACERCAEACAKLLAALPAR